MPSNLDAQHRYDLAQRIERFLVKRRADGARLIAEESTNVVAALAHLDNGRYPEGEDAMMLTEKGSAPRGERGAEMPAEVLAGRVAKLVRV